VSKDAARPEENPQERQYWAFISYSHRDKAWGDWLHKKLETYKVPKKLVGRPNRTGEVPKRLYPIFRDREELPTSANLGSIIQKGLENSRYLVVICSPRSASSLWVNQEILNFKAMGKSDRILALIVDGEPNATDKPGQEDQECFPEALRFQVDAQGALTDTPAEPVAGDARPFADGKRNALLKLLAGLLGVDYAILNDREHKRRLRRYLLAATTCFLAIATALGIWGVQEQRRLRDLRIEHLKTVEQRNRALRNLAAIHLKEGQQSLAENRNGPALLRLQASLQSYDTLGARVAAGMALPGFVPEVAAFPLGQGRLHALIAPDDQEGNALLASSGMSDSVRLTRLDGLETVAEFSPAPWVYTLARTAEGELLTAGMDGVRRMDPQTGGNELLQNLSCPGCIYALAPDGSLAAAFDQAAAELVVRTIRDAAVVATVNLQEPPFMPSGIMAFSPNGKLLAIGGAQGAVLVWDLEIDKPLGRFGGLSGQVSALAFSSDSRLLAAGEGQFLGGPGAVEVLAWDMGQPPGSPPAARLKGHEQQINHLAFSPDGRLLATSSQADMSLRLWDVAQFSPELFDNPLFAFQPLAVLPGQQVLTALGFSADGALLFAGDIRGRVRAHYVAGLRGMQLSAPDDFSLVAAAPGCTRLALLQPGGVVEVLDTVTGKEVVSVDVGPMATAIALSQDGSMLAWAGHGEAVVRHLDNGTLKDQTFAVELPVQAMAFAPDGSALALAGQGRLDVHALADGALLSSWQDPQGQASNTASVTMSHDGRFVAISSNSGPRVVAVADGALQTLQPSQTGDVVSQGVFAVAFAPAVEGAPAMLLAACQDGLVRRWSCGDWQELEPLRGHEQLVAALAASSDGSLYASSSGSEIRLWKAPEGDLLHTERTNLIGLDALHLLHNGGFVAWSSSFLSLMAGADLLRGELAPLLTRLESLLELGLPYALDRNGELVARDEAELAGVRLQALQSGRFPWPLQRTGITQATLARAGQELQEAPAQGQ